MTNVCWTTCKQDIDVRDIWFQVRDEIETSQHFSETRPTHLKLHLETISPFSRVSDSHCSSYLLAANFSKCNNNATHIFKHVEPFLVELIFNAFNNYILKTWLNIFKSYYYWITGSYNFNCNFIYCQLFIFKQINYVFTCFIMSFVFKVVFVSAGIHWLLVQFRRTSSWL